MPVVKTLDITLPVNSQSVDVTVTPYLKLTPHELHFPAEGGSASLSIDTNAENFTVGAPGMKNMERQWDGTSKSFSVIARPNMAISKAETRVSVTGRTTGLGQVSGFATITQDPNPGDALKTVTFVDGVTLFNSPCTVSRDGDFVTVSYNHSESGDDFSKSCSFSMTIDTSNSNAGKKHPVVTSGSLYQQSQYRNIHGTTTETWDIKFGDGELEESPIADADGVHRYNKWTYTVYRTNPTSYRHSLIGPGGSSTKTESTGISVFINE